MNIRLNIAITSLVAAFICCLQFSTIAQELMVNQQYYSVEDGLLHRAVYTVTDDESGFLWIGGPKGLQRFDGHEFKSWTKSDKTGLFYDIKKIGLDDGGWLWCWNDTKKEFVFLHSLTEEIQSTQERFGDQFPKRGNSFVGIPGFEFTPYDQFFKTSNGSLIIPTAMLGQIIMYNSTEGFTYVDVVKDEQVIIQHMDSDDNFYAFVGLDRLVKFDIEGQILDSFDLNNTSLAKKAGLNIDLYFKGEAKKNRDLVFTGVKLMEIYDKRSFLTAKEYKSLSQAIFDYEFGNAHYFENYFWKDTPKGWILRSKENLEESFEIDVLPGIKINERTRFFKGRMGKLWLFNDYGLMRLKLKPNLFKQIVPSVIFKESNLINSTRGILVEGDTLYCSLELAHAVSAISLNEAKQIKLKRVDDYPRPIVKSENNKILFACSEMYDMHDENFSAKIEKTNNLDLGSDFGFWSLYKDQNGTIWGGKGRYLVYKRKNNDEFKLHKQAFSWLTQTGLNGTIQNILPEGDSLLWLCAQTGLYKFDLKREEIVARYASDEEERYLPATVFYFIFKDKSNTYWIGSEEGLIRWDGVSTTIDNGSKSHLKQFTREDGLPNDVIYAIYEDDDERLWMSSDYGIICLDKQTFQFYNYLQEDGITHHEFNRTSQFRDEDGVIYFGGLNGVTYFQPNDFRSPKRVQAKMLITDFEIFDGDEGGIVNRAVDLRKHSRFEFKPNDRFFRLKFSLPTFEEKQKLLYAWKIEGIDQDWNYQNDHAIQIGVLPYGTHHLRVKGQSGNGGWSPHELNIEVFVSKPFYLQTWFLLLSFILLCFSIFTFLKAKTKFLRTEIDKATKTIQNQAQELKELDKLKSRFFANVSHELRTPLSLMLGPINRLLKTPEQSETNMKMLGFLQRNTLHLKNLVTEILDLSKLENNKLELQEEAIRFNQKLNQHLNQFYSVGTSEEIIIKSSVDVDQSLTLLLDWRNFEKIINNFLSNAIKFTPQNGSIWVLAIEKDGWITVEVKDTGHGISKEDLPHVFDRFFQSKTESIIAEGGTGIGLSMCKELAALLGGKVWVASYLGIGSSFFFSFPIRKASEDQMAFIDNGHINEESEPALLNGTRSSLDAQMDDRKVIKDTSKLLIVEDNHDLREYLDIILGHYDLRKAVNGKEAIEILESQFDPDLILSDLMMPVMDGMELINAVKSSDAYRHIPFIMLTAKSNQALKIKALRHGIDDYLHKPFDEDELKVRIHNLLQHSKERNHVIESEEERSKFFHSEGDIELLEQIEAYISDNLESDLFSVHRLGHEFGMSDSTLLRTVKRLTGLSTSKYIQEIRLNKARDIILSGRHDTVSTVAFKVGFKDAGSFSRSFKKRFGKSPSDLI